MDDPGGKSIALKCVADEQVGHTLFIRARNLGRQTGIPNLFLKFEGGNPTGTQKDRIAFVRVQEALRRGCTGATVGTCGNYGAALAYAASLVGLPTYLYVPEAFSNRRMAEMEGRGGTIVRVPGSYEDAVMRSREDAYRHGWLDANPGDGMLHLDLEAYGGIAREIVAALGDAPSTVAVPVSNGTTLAGIYHGFRSLHEEGVTSRVPRMVAGSTWWKNPIVVSFREGHGWCMDLKPQIVQETQVNEPLVNWHAFDGDEALEALRDSHGAAEFASDKEMVRLARQVRECEGLHALPASCSALCALEKLRAEGWLEWGGPHVAVLTGRRQ